MVYGCFALYEIGGELFRLRDYPEEYKLLLEDVSKAK